MTEEEFLTTVETMWLVAEHERKSRCHHCALPLVGGFAVADGRIYCHACWLRGEPRRDALREDAEARRN